MQELKYNTETEQVEVTSPRTAITDLLAELQNLKAIQKDVNASKLKKDLANKKYEKLMKKLSFGKIPDKSKQYRISMDPELQTMLDRIQAEIDAEIEAGQQNG